MWECGPGPQPLEGARLGLMDPRTSMTPCLQILATHGRSISNAVFAAGPDLSLDFTQPFNSHPACPSPTRISSCVGECCSHLPLHLSLKRSNTHPKPRHGSSGNTFPGRVGVGIYHQHHLPPRTASAAPADPTPATATATAEGNQKHSCAHPRPTARALPL